MEQTQCGYIVPTGAYHDITHLANHTIWSLKSHDKEHPLQKCSDRELSSNGKHLLLETQIICI